MNDPASLACGELCRISEIRMTTIPRNLAIRWLAYSLPISILLFVMFGPKHIPSPRVSILGDLVPIILSTIGIVLGVQTYR